MQALVIAAGLGSRLSLAAGGLPKPLVPVLGVPIIDRVLVTLHSVGVTDIVVTIGHHGEVVREHLGDGSSFGVGVRYATNQRVDDGNAHSVLVARDLLTDEFLLLMGDHLVDERILAAVLQAKVGSSVLLAVDRRHRRPGATRVLEKNGLIVDIGKDIPKWNAIDTGVFRCAPEFFVEVDELVSAGARELADVVRGVEAHTFDIASIEPYVAKLRKPVLPWWVDVDTPADVDRAERALIDHAAKNASDALAHWVHRPIEDALVRCIARRSRITPNQLSVAVNVLAYVVTVLFASGLLLAGSTLSFLVGLADGLDGKLARVKQQVTKVGSLEHAFDMLYEFSWILALAWAVHRDQRSSVSLVLAGITVALIAFYRSVYDHYGKQAGQSLDDAAPFDRRFRRIAGRRNLYNISILAAVLAGAPLAALWAIAIHAAFTAVTYALRSALLLRHLDRVAVSAAAVPSPRSAYRVRP